ncbi:hypothetical protein CTAM01_01485 [Colletotrichum tamarilloi]|uniref:Uncharacterized protein n=1 Tax=Colletotrichum tamarilloi TaxID=1209934 RepID=A0ABQ9RRY3_9PEZI|nr:uncharacterized protein CTAM01_01485 [Colletotrichum tamarilloi]KAK1510912.1 hypothetical protein CTAM01_01485 [Colletotrichum tamarilloi]
MPAKRLALACPFRRTADVFHAEKQPDNIPNMSAEIESKHLSCANYSNRGNLSSSDNFSTPLESQRRVEPPPLATVSRPGNRNSRAHRNPHARTLAPHTQWPSLPLRI